MIVENSGVVGIKSDLAQLDEVTQKLGFVRWQWEYLWATYDCKLLDSVNDEEYFLRISTKATEGKLESPDTVLEIENAYIGRTTFPHGLDYESPIPSAITKISEQKLSQLKDQLG